LDPAISASTGISELSIGGHRSTTGRTLTDRLIETEEFLAVLNEGMGEAN
jgi:hypothetical protein